MASNAELIREKVEEALGLIERLQTFKHIDGVKKLEKKIRQEMKFFKKLEAKNSPKTQDHLNCSNLLHMGALVQTLVASENPVAVMRVFSSDHSRKIVVDLVTQGGHLWIKVIARNARSLELHSTGDQSYGQRSILDQASDWVISAKENQHVFKIPEVRFVFYGGITQNLQSKLLQRGIQVVGEMKVSTQLEAETDSEESDQDSDEEIDGDGVSEEADISISSMTLSPHSNINSSNALNLDITAMIAYVSALTNGSSNYAFKEPILSQQAEWERQRPVKPYLESLFAGRKLICCESAINDFKLIIQTLGGEGEKCRSKILIDNLIDTVVPDGMSERLKSLDLSGKIKERSRAIFGTGDLLQIVTVSANSGFIRAAQGQGINLAVILHESRALTEGKMKMAVPISETD